MRGKEFLDEIQARVAAWGSALAERGAQALDNKIGTMLGIATDAAAAHALEAAVEDELSKRDMLKRAQALRQRAIDRVIKERG